MSKCTPSFVVVVASFAGLFVFSQSVKHSYFPLPTSMAGMKEFDGQVAHEMSSVKTYATQDS